jgi:hypothetical protein
MGRERISLEAKGAYPQSGSCVNLTERIQLCMKVSEAQSALSATKRTTALQGALQETGSYCNSG